MKYFFVLSTLFLSNLSYAQKTCLSAQHFTENTIHEICFIEDDDNSHKEYEFSIDNEKFTFNHTPECEQSPHYDDKKTCYQNTENNNRLVITLLGLMSCGDKGGNECIHFNFNGISYYGLN